MSKSVCVCVCGGGGGGGGGSCHPFSYTTGFAGCSPAENLPPPFIQTFLQCYSYIILLAILAQTNVHS